MFLFFEFWVQFAPVFFCRVGDEGVTHGGNVFLSYPNQQMPVWRAIVMRLGNSHTKPTDFVTVQFGADQLPLFV
ncbi:Uncharacterised protein [Vibrio cholerae]|uniref:Uncharacterized protein n=1 Tax=Vibrio cholerae TaxID=666 RepID=A0A655SH37_VIBCL|nr:Uncharacterised protein [Vibrio cholerae]CSB24161.1 Uncharacterised protein [Vibrio cholerae]